VLAVTTEDTIRPQTNDTQNLTLANPWWEVTVRLEADAGPCRIVDRRHGMVVADERYCYMLDVATGTAPPQLPGTGGPPAQAGG
jgi:hypothetical protein